MRMEIGTPIHPASVNMKQDMTLRRELARDRMQNAAFGKGC